MQVTVEFWGVLERLAGHKSRTLTLDAADSTVATALAQLGVLQPELAEPLERSACAIGDQLVDRRHPLRDGATLALLPPVAGG